MKTEMNNTKSLTRAQARMLDRDAIEEIGIPSIVLMENAGQRVVEYLLPLYQKGPIIVCCGKGNNGGDGLVVARYLDNYSLPVQVLLFADPLTLTGDAKLNYSIALNSKIKISVVDHANLNLVIDSILPSASWIIDGLFGTGLQGKVREPFDRIIQAINALKTSVLSIDIPSGLDCDTGEPLGSTIEATHTVTFTSLKKGFTQPKAKKFLGILHVASIGTPKIILEKV